MLEKDRSTDEPAIDHRFGFVMQRNWVCNIFAHQKVKGAPGPDHSAFIVIPVLITNKDKAPSDTEVINFYEEQLLGPAIDKAPELDIIRISKSTFYSPAPIVPDTDNPDS